MFQLKIDDAIHSLKPMSKSEMNILTVSTCQWSV